MYPTTLTITIERLVVSTRQGPDGMHDFGTMENCDWEEFHAFKEQLSLDLADCIGIQIKADTHEETKFESNRPWGPKFYGGSRETTTKTTRLQIHLTIPAEFTRMIEFLFSKIQSSFQPKGRPKASVFVNGQSHPLDSIENLAKILALLNSTT